MTITAALIIDTFREAMARKIFWGLFGLTVLMLLFFVLIMRIDVVQGATATITIFGQTNGRETDIPKLVRGVHGAIAGFLYTFGMFLAVFASAGLIPSVLEPGRIELILSKPVARWHILAGRFIGNVLVVLSNITLLVGGIWTIFGVKTDFWAPEFLLVIPLTVFLFSVLLSVVMLVGVLWESTAVSTMVPVVMMILSPILAQNTEVQKLLSSEWSREVWKWLYYVLPKVFDVGRMTFEMTQGNAGWHWWPIWTSAAFAIVMFGCALRVFQTRDF